VKHAGGETFQSVVGDGLDSTTTTLFVVVSAAISVLVRIQFCGAVVSRVGRHQNNDRHVITCRT